MSIRIINKVNGSNIGEITQEDLQFLTDQMEEESSKDVDYFVDRATVDMFAEAGGNKALIDMLRKAVGNTDGIDIVIEKTEN
jgi:hypothetical protein